MSGGNAGLRLKFWGVRGSVPTPEPTHLKYGGNTTCIEISSDEHVAIIDAGTGLRQLGRELMEHGNGNSIAVHLFFTHYHWDHLQGLPFFAPLFSPQGDITFYGSARLGPLRENLKDQMCAPHFPVELDNVAAKVRFVEFEDEAIELGKLRFRSFPMYHPQGATGYRVESQDGVIVHACDVEHGDPKLDRILREYSASADVLIYDAQYTPEEYVVHKGRGHSDWPHACLLAEDVNPGELILFHHDPWHDDDAVEGIERNALAAFEATSAAREGRTIHIR